MAAAENNMVYRHGVADPIEAITPQQLMAWAVKRRDELNVFIRILTDVLRDEHRTVSNRSTTQH